MYLYHMNPFIITKGDELFCLHLPTIDNDFTTHYDKTKCSLLMFKSEQMANHFIDYTIYNLHEYPLLEKIEINKKDIDNSHHITSTFRKSKFRKIKNNSIFNIEDKPEIKFFQLIDSNERKDLHLENFFMCLNLSFFICTSMNIKNHSSDVHLEGIYINPDYDELKKLRENDYYFTISSFLDRCNYN